MDTRSTDSCQGLSTILVGTFRYSKTHDVRFRTDTHRYTPISSSKSLYPLIIIQSTVTGLTRHKCFCSRDHKIITIYFLFLTRSIRLAIVFNSTRRKLSKLVQTKTYYVRKFLKSNLSAQLQLYNNQSSFSLSQQVFIILSNERNMCYKT